MILLLIILNSLQGSHAGLSHVSWSFDGHRIVCEIAWQNLTPAAKNSVRALLSGDSAYDRFSESCIWADVIRRESQYERFVTAHYVNLPHGVEGIDLTRDCADNLCVVKAITEQTSILENRASTETARLEALKFIGHFVGDLHQPLHVGYAEDRGGNSTDVTIWGEERNLHQVWDRSLIEYKMLSWEAYAAQLLGGISAVDRTLWASKNVEDWANESFQITENYIYDVGPDAEIGDDYYLTNLHTLEEQLKKAGIRLAVLLNDALR